MAPRRWFSSTENLGDGEEDLLTRFGSVSGPEDVGIIFAQVKNTVADDWLKSAGKSLAPIFKIKSTHRQSPSPSNCRPIKAPLLTVNIKTTRATVEQRVGLPSRQDRRIRHHRRAL